MTKFRYVALHPDRAAQWKKLGPALALHEVLTDLQCDAGGRVNYGRPFGYAWLLARWPGNPDERPTVRTLKRHMAKLKDAGLVEVRSVGFRGFNGGIVVRLLGSAKWQEERPAPAVQLPLLLPNVASIRRGKPVSNPVEKQRKSDLPLGTDVSLTGGQMCPPKEVKNQPEETIRAVAAAHSMPRVWKSKKDLDARRRLLLEQADAITKNYKTSC